MVHYCWVELVQFAYIYLYVPYYSVGINYCYVLRQNNNRVTRCTRFRLDYTFLFVKTKLKYRVIIILLYFVHCVYRVIGSCSI